MSSPVEPPRRQRRAAPSDPSVTLTLWAVGAVTLLRLLWLAGNPIDLYPDEAQYWIWAQHPAFGYFSKPPVIAWMIAAETTLFGNGTFAIKLAAPITHFLTSLVVFAIARRLYEDRRIAAWSAIAFVTLPGISLSAAIISTDVPLMLFWALATYALIRARESGAWRWWSAVGLAAGLGLLSKYMMGLWLASALAFLLAIREERPHLKGFLPAAVLAIIVYAPNLAWNVTHHFASYRHTEANAHLEAVRFAWRPFATFVASQFAVFGPIYFGALLIILAGRSWIADRRDLLLAVLGMPTLVVMLAEAGLSRAEPNWSAPAYVTATILVVAWLERHRRDALVQWAVVLNIALAVALFGLTGAARAIGHPLPGRLDPLHRVEGWQRLGSAVNDLRLLHPELPLLGDDRELMAALIYYMRPHPFDMLVWNPSGQVRNGFEMTQSLPDRPGGDFLWITRRTDRTEITSRFRSAETVGHVLIPLGAVEHGRPPLMREAWVVVLHGFEGYAPGSSGP